ncbi:MAG: hypothetical protein Kow00114_04250 [Kiloniellaceae bacterium]
MLEAAAQGGEEGAEAGPAAEGRKSAVQVIGDKLGPEGPGRLDDRNNVNGSLIPPRCGTSGALAVKLS